MPFCAVLRLFTVEVEEDDCKKLMRGLHCGPASHGVSTHRHTNFKLGARGSPLRQHFFTLLFFCSVDHQYAYKSKVGHLYW